MGRRYGFLASLKNGKRVYGDVYRDAEGTAVFKVQKNTEYLWLVVSGAPTEHWPIVMRRRGDINNDNTSLEEQWPYRIKLTETTPDNGFVE